MTLTEQAKALGITVDDLECEINSRTTPDPYSQKAQFYADHSTDTLSDLVNTLKKGKK